MIISVSEADGNNISDAKEEENLHERNPNQKNSQCRSRNKIGAFYAISFHEFNLYI